MAAANHAPELVCNVLDRGYVRLSSWMGDDLGVVNSAKVSFNREASSMGRREKRLLSFLWEHGHTSPFRHCITQWEVYAPLFVARQWWKYVIGSDHQEYEIYRDRFLAWNESSRRYITEEPEFYMPEIWRKKPNHSKQGSSGSVDPELALLLSNWLSDQISRGQELYQRAMDLGVAPEQARLFLPAYGMYVRWRWTSSLQGVLHFLDQRLREDAQWEIREYARAVEVLLARVFPHTVEVFRQDFRKQE